MPRIAYIEKRFGEARLEQIQQANAIIAEYAAQGFDLTVRQLYYQFVARDLIPNNLRSYKRLQDLISDARMAGYIDWKAITDRTRYLRGNQHWADAGDAVRDASEDFQLDKWERQPCRLEVWIEKDALIGVIAEVCQRNDVNYFSCRGYTSQSELWRAGQRMAYYENEGQQPIVIHLGDHDPSGIDMTRDIGDRVSTFAQSHLAVERIALNRDQIDRYNPPPNPAKMTDSRYEGYIAEHGKQSWELDALDPTTISELIEATILGHRDDDLWEEAVAEENAIKAQLRKAADNWDDVATYLEDLDDE